MSPPPSPVVRTTVDSGLASAAPGTDGNPRPIDWYAVPIIIMRSGDATGQYMFAQPMKCPPSETTTRSSGRSSPMRAATRPRIEPAVGRQAVAALVFAQGCDVDRLAPARWLRVERAQFVDERPRDHAGVATEISADVRMRGSRCDVDLHDPRAGCEEVAEAHRELVQGCPEHDRDVGFADERHRALRRRSRRSRRGRTPTAGRFRARAPSRR